MKKQIMKLLKNEVFLYALIGGACAFIDLGAFFILNSIVGVSYLISHIISVWLASTVKFFINKRFTFKNKSAKVKKQYLSSLIVLIIYLIVTEIMLYVLVDLIGFGSNLSKVIVLFLGLSVNYVLDKTITFGIF